MTRLLLAALMFASLAAAPAALADPADLVPECSGQVAAPGECTLDPLDAFIGDTPLIPGAFPGANPGIPPGPTPFDFPVVIPLGVTPFNVPVNLPLGPTPPGRLPFQQ